MSNKNVALSGLEIDALANEPSVEMKTKDELLKFLNEGMTSPTHSVTDETWLKIRNEVLKRTANRPKNDHS